MEIMYTLTVASINNVELRIDIHKKIKQCKKWESINENLVKADLQLKGCHIVIIGAYSSTDNASDEDKSEFYNNLFNILDEISNRKEVYLSGNFNSRYVNNMTLKYGTVSLHIETSINIPGYNRLGD